MDLISETIRKILPLDAGAMAAAENSLAKRGTRGLGYLKNILLKYAGITRNAAPLSPKKKTIVVCADHGVAQMGVSAYPPETTVEMTRNYLIAKGAVANALSNFARSDLAVVDMGIGADTSDIPNLICRKIAFGTKNIAAGPAMSHEEAVRAIETGITLAKKYAKEGYRCFLPGEMGIANTTASAAIVAACGNLTAEEATGRGTNISDERLKQKIAVVRQALSVNRPNPGDGIDILAKIGGFEFGCMAGIMLGAAANQCVTMLDGFNTGAAALIAKALCPRVTDYLIGSHLAAEKAHRAMLKLLGLHPYMKMDFRLGEATGSSIAIDLLDSVLYFLHNKPKIVLPQPLMAAKTVPAFSIGPLDESKKEACSLYIDNLTKPLHSMGRLEEFAIQLAGITSCSRPRQLKKALLYFSTENEPLPQQTLAFARHAGAILLPVLLPRNAKKAALVAFTAAQSVSDAKLVALTADESSADDALNAAVRTASLSVAAGGAAIFPDNALSLQGIAAAAQEQPAIKSYIFPPPRQYTLEGKEAETSLQLTACLDLNTRPAAGIGCTLMMKVADAALHMLNDMKTFGYAGVSVANDGPGAKRQDLSIK